MGSGGIIIVFVGDGKGGEAVGLGCFLSGERLYNIGGLAEGMGQGRGVEEGFAISIAGVDDVTAIRATWVVPELDDFSVHVEELIEGHFVLFEEAEVAGGLGVFSSEGEPGFFGGLEADSFNRSAIGVKDL